MRAAARVCIGFVLFSLPTVTSTRCYSLRQPHIEHHIHSCSLQEDLFERDGHRRRTITESNPSLVHYSHHDWS